MLSTALAPEQLMFRSLTGVRQRVILVVLASVLALATQSSHGGLPPNGAEGALDIAVKVGGERLQLTCRGSGHITVLFLANGETAALPFWEDAREGAATFTRVCTLDMTGVDMRAAGITPAKAEQIAADLDGVLAGEEVPAPYVLVAAVKLEPVTARFTERSDGLVNGTLLIDSEPRAMIGWIVEGEGTPRPVTLETIDHLLLAIRSLVWPPTRMHTP